MPEVAITDDEVVALGKKLDQFGEVLTPKEQLMLYAMIKAAGQTFAAAPSSPQNPATPMVPKLGAAFDAAFIPGKAAQFEPDTELTIGPVTIVGSVHISIK
jgi:hypothetical protein